MACGKRCGCAGKCNCVVFGDGTGSGADQCVAVDGNGTPEFPYVVRNLCPGVTTGDSGQVGGDDCCIGVTGSGTHIDPYVVRNLCPGKLTLGTISCGATASLTGNGECDSPYRLSVGVRVDNDPENILTCSASGLFVPPPPDPSEFDPTDPACSVFTQMVRISRGATSGIANCGTPRDLQDLPGSGATLSPKDAVDAAGVDNPNGTPDGTESGFYLMEEQTNALTITNPSDCWPMAITLNALGRARIDTRARIDWPAMTSGWMFAAQLRLGLTVSGSVGGDRDYVTQRAQFNIDTRNTGGTSGCTDQSRESQAWTDWDTVPSLVIAPGGSIQIHRWADLQVRDESGGVGTALTGTGGQIAREVRWNLPGITAVGVAAANL